MKKSESLKSNERVQSVSVAIQGGFGAFHEIAAKKFFAEIPVTIVPCDTFGDLFEELRTKKVDCGIVAIENSVAGSLLQNHSYIYESGLPIVGEQYIRVIQNLIALPGQSMDDIKEVHSHPVAIQQCHLFLNGLRKKGVRIVDSLDTALSAKWIRENELMGVAALASDLAADMYSLEILKVSVEDNKRNFTRFMIVAASEKVKRVSKILNRQINKSSICFSLPHKQGSLSQVLSVLAIYDMNLTKIQSLPIVGIEWQYMFYVDLVFSDQVRYRQALSAIEPLTENLKILGVYENRENSYL